MILREKRVEVVERFSGQFSEEYSREIAHLKEFGYNPRCCSIGKAAATLVDKGILVKNEETSQWELNHDDIPC